MMAPEELRENGFPIPRYLDLKGEAPELPEGWVETPRLKKTSLTPPPKVMIALDCEMVSGNCSFHDSCILQLVLTS